MGSSGEYSYSYTFFPMQKRGKSEFLSTETCCTFAACMGDFFPFPKLFSPSFFPLLHLTDRSANFRRCVFARSLPPFHETVRSSLTGRSQDISSPSPPPDFFERSRGFDASAKSKKQSEKSEKRQKYLVEFITSVAR